MNKNACQPIFRDCILLTLAVKPADAMPRIMIINADMTKNAATCEEKLSSVIINSQCKYLEN